MWRGKDRLTINLRSCTVYEVDYSTRAIFGVFVARDVQVRFPGVRTGGDKMGCMCESSTGHEGYSSWDLHRSGDIQLRYGRLDIA